MLDSYIFQLLDGLVLAILLVFIFRLGVNKKKIIWFGVIGSIFTGTIINIFGPNLNSKTFFFFWGYVILSKFIFKLKITQQIFGVGLCFILAAIGDIFAYFIFVVLLNYTVQQVHSSFFLFLTAHLINCTVAFSFIFIVRALRHWKIELVPDFLKGNKIVSGYICILLLLIWVNFLGAINFKLTSTQLIAMNFVTIVILNITGLVFLFTNYRLITKNEENEHLKEYIKIITKMSSELRRFKHDYQNILQGLTGLIQLEKWEDLKKYFQEVLEESKNVSENNFFYMQKIKIYSLLGLIATKINKAEELGINFNLIAVDEISNISMKEYELCELLGIYLDNAIEEAQKTLKKEVNIKFYCRDGVIKIRTENTFEEEPDIDRIKQTGFSSKGENRGLGLWIADKIVSKYQDILNNTFIKDGKFIQELIIPTRKETI